MADNLQALGDVVGTAIAGSFKAGVPITSDLIRGHIAMFRTLPLYEVTDSEAEHLARVIESRHDITMSIGSILTGVGHEPWLDNARKSIDPFYWDRYRQLLTGKGYSGHVLAGVDDTTDRILAQLENPEKEGTWSRRGMVMGYVQSGKTANYIGLVCKAADAGYKFIVVIAGIHNNLRNQTQLRVDEGFVGRDSGALLQKRADKFVGVGMISSKHKPVTFTTSRRDFDRATASNLGLSLQNLRDPAILVIKKNASTLKNLVDWLREHSVRAGGKIHEPMLLIDDEADNASINVGHARGEISRINGQIRDLLNIFDRSCYVGYTATPFANIFIDPESTDEMVGNDLFPRHFIVSLDPPSNYFGAHRVFLDEECNALRTITDSELLIPLTHKINVKIGELPHSLLTAIRQFVLVRAIRIARGDKTVHNSMLVHVSRFVRVQAQVRNEIHDVLSVIQQSIRLNSRKLVSEALLDPQMMALHEVWREEFAGLEFKWNDLQPLLYDAAAPIRVVAVNSNSSGALNYADHAQDGLNVIAVGGMALSRGLTLEGLSVSYFLRNTAMYDTLMQMGRWFGYRDGYEDLCRIWLLPEAIGWYEHIAESIEELRAELQQMESVGGTPEDFGLKVRSHPDTLIVTARNKMGTGQEFVVSVGLANNFIETSVLRDDAETLELHRNAATRLAQQLHASKQGEFWSGGRLVRGAPAASVLEFLAAFRNHALSELTETAPVIRYIEERQYDELQQWDVLFAGVGKNLEATDLVDWSLGFPLTCQRRSRGGKSVPGKKLLVSDKRRVASRGVERAGLTVEEIQSAQQEYEATWMAKNPGNKSGKRPNFPDKIYREKRQHPLLIIHLLAIGSKDEDLSKTRPVVAWSISFPRTARAEKEVQYVVGSVWRREFMDSGYDESGHDDA